jgi:hypothetical protein
MTFCRLRFQPFNPLQAMFVDQPIQGALADAEDSRCLNLVAVRLLQGLLHKAPLHLVQVEGVRTAYLRSGRSPVQIVGQIVQEDG